MPEVRKPAQAEFQRQKGVHYSNVVMRLPSFDVALMKAAARRRKMSQQRFLQQLLGPVIEQLRSEARG